MEAVPRMPMIALELKIAVDFPFVDAVKQYIFGHYGEEPDKYNEELRKFEQLRSSAVAVTRDFEGCSTLRKYFGQLHYLQSRVPMGEGQDAAVTVIWKDIFTGKAVKYDDIHFEQAAILYNLGALHSLLGVMDSRQSEEGMKVSCTHFQCAAGAFTYLRDHFSHSYSADTSLGILNLYITLMLGQAQECLLEKSMLDNRKSFLIARISAQVAEYYKEACHFLENHEVSSLLGREQKEWKKQIQVKISYFSCIANLYMGKQADEQQKYGERLAFYQSALDKLNEAVKCAKGQQDPTFNEALQFTMDVVGGKYNSAKKDNDFIYHESVPSLDNLPAVKGAPLVKALPFQPTDPSVTGPDILARLVPMEAHKDSSLYSEEKAKMLREVGEKIEEKNKELQHFMDSLGIELEQLERPPAYDRIPQALMEKCAALSVRPDAIKGIVQAMQTLSSVFTDVEASLKEIEDQLEEDEKSENICQEVIGPRPLSNIIKEMSKEWGKYMEAHQKASVTNMELRKAMNLHISNLRLMSGPLDQLRAALPIPTTTTGKSCTHTPPADETVGDNLKKMLRKVGEMREQRTTLEQQIRDMVQGDDITGVLVTAAPGSVRELFTKEMKKYDQLKVYIDQNLSAQENILRALTDANAKYALVRKASEEADDKWNNAVQALVSSYDAYEDLIKKSEEGIHFYKDLEGKVTKLLQRAKSVCRVQDEERQKILERESKKKPPPRPTAPKPPMREPDKPDFGIPPDTGGDIDMSDLPEDLKSLPPDVLRLIMADTALEEASLPRLNSAHRYANYAHPPFHHTSPRHTPQVPGPRDKAQQRPSAPSPNLPTYPAATGSQMAFSPGYAQPLHPGTPQHFAGPRYDNGPHPTMGSSGSLPSVPPFASPYAGPQAPPVAAGGQSSLPTSLAGGGFAPATSVPYQHGPMQPPARLPAYPYHVPPPYQDAVRHPQYTAPPQGGYPSAPHNQHHPLPQQQPTPGQGGYRQAMPAEAHMAHGAHAPYMQSPLHVSSQPQLVQYGHGTPLPGQFRGSAPLPGTDPYQVLGPAPHCMVAPQHEAHAQPRPAALSAGSQPYPYTVAQPGTGQVNPTDARAIHPAGPLPPHPGVMPHAAQSQVTGGIIHPTLTPTPPISNAQLQAFPPAPGAVLRPTPVPSSPASGMVHPAPTPTPPPIGTLHPTPTPTPPPLGGIVPSTATTAPLPPRQSSATDDLLSTSFDGQQSSLQTRNSQPLLQPTRADMVAKGVKIIERDPFVQQDLLRRLVKETERFKAMVESMESLPDGGGITLLERKWKELQELQEKDVRSFSISIARCYTMKNRNPDFMPFDKNRVVLASGKDDYINASMIEELSAYCPRIIATQAPLATTAADFWLMVYEQKIAIIVMLVSEPELEKQRVLRYFPTEKGQQMAQGIVMVSLTSQKVAPSYTERMFALKLRGQSLTRTVVHLHYHCWPELGLPESTSSLLNFIAEVHGHYLHQRPLHMPIVVHCSSGVGRTGAFCLAYAAVQEVEAGKGLPDLMPLVRRMRQQRKHMIQEKLQLRFCYEVVLRHTEQVLQRHGIYVSGVAAPKHPVTTSQKAPAPVRQDSQDIVLGGDLSFSSIQATVARLSIKTCPSPPQSSLEPAVATPSTTSSEGNPPHTSTTICTADEVVVDAPLPPANGDIAAAAVCAQEDGPTTIKAVPTPAPSSVAIESTNGGAETARSGEPRSNGVGRQASHAPGIVAAKGAVGDVSGGSTLDLLATLSPEAFTLDGNIKGGRQKITRQSFTHPQAGGGLQAPERPDDPLSKLDALWSLGKK
ncbi:unnamed protein product [Lampetra planeri]